MVINEENHPDINNHNSQALIKLTNTVRFRRDN